MMMHRFQALFASCLLVATLTAQYSGPESVEYDPIGDRYFVSNTSSRVIKVRDQAGVVTDLTSVLPNAPYGLELLGNVLYACTGNGIRGFDRVTGQQVYQRDLGALFPNGITTDGEYLYVTDFNSNARRIYKVDPVANTHTVLVSNTGGQPNGIVWDAANQWLAVAFWGSNAPVKAYDRITGLETVLVANTGLGNVDGITLDCDGRYLLASWSPARISRFTWTSAASALENLNVPGLSNPADIDFDEVNQRICIPNSGNNTVTLQPYTCLSTGVKEPVVRRRIAVPNPAQLGVRLDPPLEGVEPFVLRDASGRAVASGSMLPGLELSLGDLGAGVYVLQLTRLGHAIRLVKE